MVNLNNCKPGDILLSKHGKILVYAGPSGLEGYPHEITYPDGSRGTRTDDGHVFRKKRLEEDEDVISILG